MIHFDCDYMAGAHPEVLKAITDNNNVQTAGYGCDDFCERAKRLIREACGARGEKESKVRFVTSWETTEADIEAFAEMIK